MFYTIYSRHRQHSTVWSWPGCAFVPMSNNPPSVRLERGREGWAGIWSALLDLHRANLCMLCKLTDSNQACCKDFRCFSTLLYSCQGGFVAVAVGECWRRRWLGGVSRVKFKGLSRSLRTDWCVVFVRAGRTRPNANRFRQGCFSPWSWIALGGVSTDFRNVPRMRSLNRGWK